MNYNQRADEKPISSHPQAISILPQTGGGLILMGKNKKKSKGPQNKNKNAQNNHVNAAPKKEKKPEASKPVEAQAEKAMPKAQEPKAKVASPKAEATKEKSFLTGIVDSVKKLVKA